MTSVASTPSSIPAPLVVFEGIDGSGKGTHAARLRERMEAAGISCGLISFPRYQSTFFGSRIGEFLNGDFGALSDLDPFLISLLYAGDRMESQTRLQELRNEHAAVILDRYVPSNIAHQSARRTGAARETLRQWIEQIEYRIFELPQPDLVILLDIPVEFSQELIRRKQQRSYTERVTDLQESDPAYLQEVRNVYLQLAATQPNWITVPVVSQSSLRSLEELQNEIWQMVRSSLPKLAGSSG